MIDATLMFFTTWLNRPLRYKTCFTFVSKEIFFSCLILKDVFKVKPGANFTRIGWQQQKKWKTKQILFVWNKCLVWLKKTRQERKGSFDSNPITLIASFCWKFLERKDDMESSLLAWSISIPVFSHTFTFRISYLFFLLQSLLESFCYRCNVFFLITFALFFPLVFKFVLYLFFICLFLFLFPFVFNSFVCNKFACFKQQEIHPRRGWPSRQTPSVIHQHFVKKKQ